jgi:hypothetical protein
LDNLKLTKRLRSLFFEIENTKIYELGWILPFLQKSKSQQYPIVVCDLHFQSQGRYLGSRVEGGK